MSKAGDEITKNNTQKISNQIKNSKEEILDILIWGATIFGIGAIGVAVYMPFFIKNTFLGTANYSTYGDLGPIGDYIGGTTVAILTAASVLLLLATILMQRREIKISQRGIEELVKQTEASVKQAEEARQEAVITNETMRKQQFESTFFNMINLHRNLVDRMKTEKTEGYHVFEESLKSLYEYYIDVTHKSFKQRFIVDEPEEIEYLIDLLQMRRYSPAMSIKIGSESANLDFFKKLDFRDVLIYKEESSMIRNYEKFALINRNRGFIQQSFLYFIGEHGSVLNSYFNNFTTIINFLHESIYESGDRKRNTENNKIYRKILFSQLSPQEMILIYYYARYHDLDGQMIEELKTYNVFYPRLLENNLMFEPTDSEEIWRLSKS